MSRVSYVYPTRSIVSEGEVLVDVLLKLIYFGYQSVYLSRVVIFVLSRCLLLYCVFELV